MIRPARGEGGEGDVREGRGVYFDAPFTPERLWHLTRFICTGIMYYGTRGQTNKIQLRIRVYPIGGPDFARELIEATCQSNLD